MPAEWMPHQATWISWPHKRESWPGKFEPVEPVMAKFVAELSWWITTLLYLAT
jgi:agmatine deiminase